MTDPPVFSFGTLGLLLLNPLSSCYIDLFIFLNFLLFNLPTNRFEFLKVRELCFLTNKLSMIFKKMNE